MQPFHLEEDTFAILKILSIVSRYQYNMDIPPSRTASSFGYRAQREH